MSQPELLRRVVAALESAAIPYMATGSIVSGLQGEPRSTHDVDLVVSLTPQGATELLRAFEGPEFYLEETAVRSANATGGMFNLLDVTGGDKVDFWVLTDEPFDRERFARRCPEQVGDLSLMVSRPEDTILQKLRWSKLSGGSEKQFVDALRVYEVQFQRLDQQYLARWAAELGVEALWARLRSEAMPL